MAENPFQSPETHGVRTAPPVKLKYWGFLTLTRNTYLIFQSCALLAVALVLISCYTIWPPEVRAGNIAWELAPLVMTFAAAAEVVETFVILRKFKAKQREADALWCRQEELAHAPPTG